MAKTEGSKTGVAPKQTRMSLIVGMLGVLLIGTAAIPLLRDRRTRSDPTAAAQTAYRSLQSQITTTSLPASTATGAEAEGTQTALGDVSPAPLRRDLFAPAVGGAPQVPAAPGTAASPALPTLNGIFIDGESRQAVVSGERVSVGDVVAGYRVAAIRQNEVILSKGRSTLRLQLGGTP